MASIFARCLVWGRGRALLEPGQLLHGGTEMNAYHEYELRKAELKALNLTPQEYEFQLEQLAKELGL